MDKIITADDLKEGEDVYDCKKCKSLTIHKTIISTFFNERIKCLKCGTEKEID